MQWILKRFCYDIKDYSGNNHKKALRADMLFSVIYTVVSLFNAVKAWIPDVILSKYGFSTGDTDLTWIIIGINLIILFRLNIDLYIRFQDNIKNALDKIKAQNQVANELMIKAWEIKKTILIIGYVIDALIIMLCQIYGQILYNSLSIVIIVSVLETFFYDLLNNYEVRYRAVARIYIGIEEK